jgi:hypothetical protein
MNADGRRGYAAGVRSRIAASESADRIRRLCTSITDSRDLRLAVLAELRALVGFDSYAWLMTDPQTWVGSSPLADVPCLPELPSLIRLKYLTGVNRWTDLPPPGLATLHAQTNGDLARARCGPNCSGASTSATWHRSPSSIGSAAGDSSTCGGHGRRRRSVATKQRSSADW